MEIPSPVLGDRGRMNSTLHSPPLQTHRRELSAIHKLMRHLGEPGQGCFSKAKAWISTYPPVHVGCPAKRQEEKGTLLAQVHFGSWLDRCWKRAHPTSSLDHSFCKTTTRDVPCKVTSNNYLPSTLLLQVLATLNASIFVQSNLLWTYFALGTVQSMAATRDVLIKLARVITEQPLSSRTNRRRSPNQPLHNVVFTVSPTISNDQKWQQLG